MAGRIILVRHGETEANRTECFAESEEIPLTEEGRRQARDAARRLAAGLLPHRVFSSPFARARETGEIIARELRLEMEILEGIHERDFGCLKGHPYGRMGELMAADPSCDLTRIWLWKPEGGESLDEVRLRAVAVLNDVRHRYTSQDVVLVCHGAVIQALTAHISGDWTKAKVPANCEMLVIDAEAFGRNHPFPAGETP